MSDHICQARPGEGICFVCKAPMSPPIPCGRCWHDLEQHEYDPLARARYCLGGVDCRCPGWMQ